MAGRGRPRNQPRRNADGGNGGDQRDPRDIEIERLQQRVMELEIQQEVDDEETESDPSVWGEEEENPFGKPQQNSHNMSRDDPLRSFGVMIDIPDFEGRAHPDDFIGWLSTVERIFDLRDIPEHLKVKLVAIKLKKSASLWWDHVKKQRRKEGRSKVETWAKMKKLLQGKFLPVNHRQEAFLDYHNLSQRTSSVDDFIAEFDRLRMRCGVEEEEEQTIARFLGALRTDISDVVYLQQYWSYADVCRLAVKVEKQLKNRNQTTGNRIPISSRLTPTTSSKTPSTKTVAAPVARNNPANPQTIRCFKCQGIGHLARECPNKQLVTLVEETTPVYDTDHDAESVEEEGEVIYADQGEALVVQRVLNTNATKTVDDESWLRHNIFRTKCTTKGKVCNVIIVYRWRKL
ncbi:hypothetical protein LXL04_013285 [Taraxacum kok-saghyz]